MALMTYASEPFTAALPTLRVEDGRIVAGERSAFRAEQSLQIAVLTDFCNECGNCVTACPTSGEPYRDKPRLYLDRGDFEAEADHAFMVFDDGSVEGRYAGQTHRLELNGTAEYSSPSFRAQLDAETLGFIEGSVLESGTQTGALSLVPAAEMFVLARGLRRSMGHLPTASSGARTASSSRVRHPGYEE
jgi:ferredoxin